MSINPRYPIYIVSKGRWESRLTARALDKMRVNYHIVIEPPEYPEYSTVISPSKILTLPFSNLGLGSIPARNWIWEHAIDQGAERHWILDDNIEAFNRLNRNIKPVVETGAIFRAAEDFIDRYNNIALAGFNYYSFCKQTEKIPPYYLNTRIYSCILIKNDIPYRWRGRYNEDTDLSLRVLKDGWCTLLFNAFLAGKVCTMRMKGGNTDELYREDGRKKMAEALVDLHPDVAKVVWKFNRWHHHVNYRPFKENRLVKKPSIEIPNGINDYGMILKEDGDNSTVSLRLKLEQDKMNLKNVLKTYGLLRTLSDDETALLNTLRAMNDTERELLVESLSPQTKKPTKKEATKSVGKSRRAASISTAIQGTAGAAGRSTGPCSFSMDGEECGAPASDPIHDSSFGYAGYHPFVEQSIAAGAATA